MRKLDAAYINGKVYTVDSENPVAQAFGVVEDRFAVVGTNEEVLASCTPDTPVIDLQGQVVLPGLTDAHLHIFGTGQLKLELNAVGKTKEEILALYQSLIGTPYCAWGNGYPGEQEFDYDMKRNALFCMENEDGEIIGTITVDEDPQVEALTCWSKTLQPSAELSRLGVRTDMQNQGIARQLLQHGMEELKKQGKRSVHFLVCKTNKKALRSYEKLHFDVVGESDLFDEDWWCYEKEL